MGAVLTSFAGFQPLLQFLQLGILPHQLSSQFFSLLFDFPQISVNSKQYASTTF
jgi:hypothetical protein